MLKMLSPLSGGGFVVAYAQVCVFYYTIGLFLHSVLPALMTTKTVQVAPRKPWSIQRDAFYSLGPLAVKAMVWTTVEWLHANRIGLLYKGPITSYLQVAYMLLCVVMLDYLHDAWFYITHRMLHWGPLYRHVHYIHHKSSVPSAFTGYSFHVIEALIVFANEVIVCFLFPIHMDMHRVYHLWTTAIHQGGHAGYEMAPFIPSLEGLVVLAFRGPHKTPLPALNTVQHHDMHHRFPNRHFSLYFTHLDRWFGTLHQKYDAEVQSFFNEKHKAQLSSGYSSPAPEVSDKLRSRSVAGKAEQQGELSSPDSFSPASGHSTNTTPGPALCNPVPDLAERRIPNLLGRH